VDRRRTRELLKEPNLSSRLLRKASDLRDRLTVQSGPLSDTQETEDAEQLLSWLTDRRERSNGLPEMWKVIAEPIGGNPPEPMKEKGAEDKNLSGLVIYLTNGEEKREVSRVAYVRRFSSNPKDSFQKRLQKELDKANSSVQVMNELYADYDRELESMRLKRDELRDKEREILETVSSGVV